MMKFWQTYEVVHIYELCDQSLAFKPFNKTILLPVLHDDSSLCDILDSEFSLASLTSYSADSSG